MGSSLDSYLSGHKPLSGGDERGALCRHGEAQVWEVRRLSTGGKGRKGCQEEVLVVRWNPGRSVESQEDQVIARRASRASPGSSPEDFR